MPFSVLDSINQQLTQQVLAQTNAYVQNRNVAHLVNANAQLEAQLVNIALIIALSKRGVTKNEVRAYEDQTESFVTAIVEKRNDLEARFTEQNSRINASEQRLEELFSRPKRDVRKQISNSPNG